MSSRAPFACVLSGVIAACPCACARTPVADPLADAFEARGVARASELAPDLHGRAVQARREAAASAEEGTRKNARARAELWLQAAIVEAQRIEAQRAATAAEARTVQAEAQLLAVLREREQLERELARAEARRQAETRAQRMLAGGALAEASQRGDDAGELTLELLADATSFAIERTALLLAAARAFGLDTARADVLAARLDALAAQTNLRQRLRAALDLMQAVERALGDARSARPGPTSLEHAALRADAAERGLALELNPNGARLTLDGRVFAAGRADPSAEGTRAFAHLVALLRLHPRGAVAVEAGSTALAGRRARSVVVRLRPARPDLRIVPAQRPSAEGVVLLLQAYGTAPALAAPSSASP